MVAYHLKKKGMQRYIIISRHRDLKLNLKKNYLKNKSLMFTSYFDQSLSYCLYNQ